METKDFKKLFHEIANLNEYIKTNGGWYKQSEIGIVTLELQKSSYSRLYYLNIKTFVHAISNHPFTISKDLIKKDMGTIFTRQKEEYSKYFDLENGMSIQDRKDGLNSMFKSYLNEYINDSLSDLGLRTLIQNSEVYIFPHLLDKFKEVGII